MTGQAPLGAIAVVVIVAMATACQPMVAPVQEAPAEPAGQVGPELVIDVVNRSDRELVIGYEFETPNASGGGEGTMPPCERMEMLFGSVAGDYEILLDRERVLEGAVPDAMPDDGFLIVRLTIDADGDVDVIGPRWTRIPPELRNQALPECG